MKLAIVGFTLLNVLHLMSGTCVLESEFGFILNCNFKKSGLFRVRNLGGLKAHFGLGFSIGDELGLPESLGNLEGNRRRALNQKTGFSNKFKPNDSSLKSNELNTHSDRKQNTSSMTEVLFLPLGVPKFKPLPTFENVVLRRNGAIITNVMNESTEAFFQPRTENEKLESGSNQNVIYKSSAVTHEIIENKGVSHNIENKQDGIFSKETSTDQYKPIASESANNYTILAKKSNIYSSLQALDVIMVMNAPREYYPSGYDKNFDDDFKSKVDLPPTNFSCASQKYFPGLYANIDLDCMVFHVCAVTEDGLIMKSFLCPESTLFDQSILKCNWWFYVDCRNSTYDSNLPVFKSYQLMKSFSYFSNYTQPKFADRISV